MKNRIFGVLLIISALFATMFLMTACGKNGDSIVGTWNSANGDEVLIFEADAAVQSLLPMTADGGKAATGIQSARMARLF